MFTEGLDETAINWVKQKSDVDQQPRSRSPLTEKLTHDPFPKSPLIYNTNASLVSPHGLPPLKFHSGLLQPHSILVPRIEDDDDYGCNDGESVASVSDHMDINSSEEEEEEEDVRYNGVDFMEKPIEEMMYYNEDEEEIFGSKSCSTKLNRGLLNNLKIEVPDSNRRFTDGDLGFNKCPQKVLTPSSGSNISNLLRERVQLRNAQRASGCGKTMLKEADVMGTPSAPPIMEVGTESKGFEVDTQPEHAENGVCESRESGFSNRSKEGLADWKSESQRGGEPDERQSNAVTGEREGENLPYWQTCSLDNSTYYNTSDQYAWKTLIAYDACIRLCLYSWGRGCMEAPEFLRDECVVLRNAFGLHKFLLQPRGVQVQATEVQTTKRPEQMFPLKAKKVMGKIRVEGNVFVNDYDPHIQKLDIWKDCFEE